VYVIGAGDTVQVRDVTVGAWSGDRWIITSGLTPGDRVIVDGLQKTGPGAVVKPVPMTTTPDSASAGSSPK
jgi:membrane fusion protein, multidrug efflux system